MTSPKAIQTCELADEPAIIELFSGSERPKLLALLAGKRLTAWAGVSADHTSSDHIQLEGTLWNSHRFLFIPKGADEGTINQTYLRPKGSHVSSHYDVCLNYAQLKRAWPHLTIHRGQLPL